MVPPDSLILVAGFVLAHAAWSVSDLSKGELLVPLAVVELNGQRQLLRFEAPTQEQAIAEGKAILTNRQAELDAWAFGREGLMPEGTGKVDVLTVDAWTKGMARPITFVQRLSPYSSGAFGIKGDAMVVVDGKALEGTEAARLVRRLYDGVLQHPKAGQLWQGWRVK
jgi:hypothetical protein